jgi:hypothetical protein
MLRNINHDNIIKLYEIHEDNNSITCVFPLYGLDVKTWVKNLK